MGFSVTRRRGEKDRGWETIPEAHVAGAPDPLLRRQVQSVNLTGRCRPKSFNWEPAPKTPGQDGGNLPCGLKTVVPRRRTMMTSPEPKTLFKGVVSSSCGLDASGTGAQSKGLEHPACVILNNGCRLALASLPEPSTKATLTGV